MNSPAMFAFSVCSVAILAPGTAQTDWEHSFRVSAPGLPTFEGGILIPYRINDASSGSLGYALDGVASRTGPRDPEVEFDVGYLARFNKDGLPLWSVALDPGASATSLDLVAIAENANLFFATYDEPETFSQKAFRFGLFRGTDRTAVFAKRFLTTPTTQYDVEYFTPEKIGVTLNMGETIESVVFDGTGQPVFSKSYASPLFSPAVSPTLARDLLPDGSGYLTAVAKSVFNFDDFSSEVTLIPFFTGLDGEVTSANSFTFKTFSPGAIAFPDILSDHSVLYRIPAAAGGISIGGTPIPVTHLIKVGADGTLVWAKTIASSSILTTFVATGGIYLAGARPNFSAPGNRNALVLKINPADGTLMDQAAFASISNVDNATSIASDGTNLLVQIFSTDPFGDPGNSGGGTSTLVKLDGDLNLMGARQYTGPQTISFLAPDAPVNNMSHFLFSAHDPTDGSIKSITLNDQLENPAGCDLFAPFTPGLGSGVTASDLAVSTAAANVTSSEVQTPYSDSTISFSPAPLTITDICSVSHGLTIQIPPNGTEVNLGFPTGEGITYSLQFTPVLGTPFTTVETVLGTGNNALFTRPIGNGKGFYRVSPPPPGE